jgi:putative transposase
MGQPFGEASPRQTAPSRSFALVEQRTGKVDRWQNSSQKQRWLAAALLDIEPGLRRLRGYRALPQLREALQEERL